MVLARLLPAVLMWPGAAALLVWGVHSCRVAGTIIR